MMTRKQQRAKGLNNADCFTDKGHDWRSTSANTFRICARPDCRATERLDDTGTWVDVTATNTQLKNHRPLVPTRPAPTLLWDERLLLILGTHPRQREIERESFVRYDRLRGR